MSLLALKRILRLKLILFFFVEGFMYSCEQYVKNAKSSLPLPQEIMQAGFDGVKAEKAVIAGSFLF